MKFSFSAWGRTLALAGGYWAINGGVVNFFYSNPSAAICTACGAYCLAVGVIIFLFLYPVKLGSCWLGPILWIVNFNYLPVGIALILLGPFCSVAVPTVLAGATIVLAGIFYVVAGIRREKGTPLKDLQWNCGDDPKGKGGRE